MKNKLGLSCAKLSSASASYPLASDISVYYDQLFLLSLLQLIYLFVQLIPLLFSS